MPKQNSPLIRAQIIMLNEMSARADNKINKDVLYRCNSNSR